MITASLAACAGAEPAAIPTSEPSPTVSAAPTPTPTPERTLPAIDELALAPGGLNLLVIGEPAPLPADPAAMIVFDPDYCADVRDPDDPFRGQWVAVDQYRNAESRPIFAPGVDESGVVVAVQVFSGSPIRTTEGIGIGSTVSEILAAYPTVTGPFPEYLSQLYIVSDGTHQLVFETSWAGAGDGYWLEEELDRVLIMTAQPLSTSPFALWGTDGGWGSCL